MSALDEMDIAAQQAVAQGWCEPELETDTLNPHIAAAIARPVARALRAWYDTAAQHARNEEFYRGLLWEIGEALGPEAYRCDDGTTAEKPLCVKLPEMVRALKERTESERAFLESINQYLTVPAAEYVPSIRDVWKLIDDRLTAISR